MTLPARSLVERHDGGSPPTRFRGGIAKGLYPWSFGQHRTHHGPLDTDTAPVNHADRLKAQAVCLRKIFYECDFGVFRRKGMQIEDIRDRNSQWFVK